MTIGDRKALRTRSQGCKRRQDAGPAITWLTDPAGETRFMSQAWEAFTGQQVGEALGLGWLRCVHAADREQIETIFKVALENQAPFSLTYRLRTGRGGYAWVRDGAVPSFEPGSETFIGYLGSVCTLGAEEAPSEAGGWIGPPDPLESASASAGGLELIVDHLLIAHALMVRNEFNSLVPPMEHLLREIARSVLRQHPEIGLDGET